MLNDQRLWAPWRLDYVTGGDPSARNVPPPEPRRWLEHAEHGCFLCRAAAEFDDRPAALRHLLVAAQGDRTLVVLNRFPYSNGHLMVAPRRHVGPLAEMTPDEHLEAMQWLGRLTDVLGECLGAEGFNIGLNLGRVAGAGLPGHLHWHLVPRWTGDHNFMTVNSGTRVIPQSLDALWDLLAAALNH